MSRIGYIIRVANLLDTSGNEILWTTRLPTPLPSGTVRQVLDRAPLLNGASLALLDPVASSGGCVWPAIAKGNEAVELMRRNLDWPGATDAPPRLREYVTATDTSIVMNVSGLSTPQVVFINGESMRLDSETSPGVYNVTRALGSLGVARETRWRYGETEPVVLSRPSEPRGFRVSIHEWDGSVETLVYRGMLRGVNRGDHGPSLDIVSSVGWIRDREVTKPTATSVSGAYGRAVLDLESLTCTFYDTLRDSWVPAYARIWWGESWVVVPVDPSNDVSLPGDALWFVGDAPIVQWGVGAAVYPVSQVPPGLVAQAEPDNVEGLFAVEAGAPSAVLTAMLTAQWPPGQVGGMAAGDIGDLTALDEAYGSGDLTPPHSVSSDWWAGADKETKKLTDAIGVGLMSPMGLGLTADFYGLTTVIDWTRALGFDAEIGQGQLLNGLSGTSDVQPVRSVRWQATLSGGEYEIVWNSDLVSQVSGGGRVIEASAGWVQDTAAWQTDRMNTILQVYQLATPTCVLVVPLSVAVSSGLTPGIVLGLTCSTIWNRDGGRGIVDVSSFIMSAGRRLGESGGSVELSVALTGYSSDLNEGQWAPSGIVVSEAAGVITLTMDNGDDVDDWFTSGNVLALTDPTGLVLDGTLTVTSSTTTTVTVTGLGVSVSPGDRIELASYATYVYPDAAYQSQGYQYV